MPTHQKKKSSPRGPLATVLETIGKIIPGFDGFFKKMEHSKTFGARIGQIRQEIDRRFGTTKK